MLFAILQKYDFSSKSQPIDPTTGMPESCLRYCKSTIFQANHNYGLCTIKLLPVVCDTAKVRFFKQITTHFVYFISIGVLFAILQKYDFSSKSQQERHSKFLKACCLRYCKSTIFQANHNGSNLFGVPLRVVCDTAKVRFFKQITTPFSSFSRMHGLFAILQKYDFSSKSQRTSNCRHLSVCCLRYCKSTIFQANHNAFQLGRTERQVVCDTAKVRFFKQITTPKNQH